jgi:hypothetical protein
MSGQTSLSNVLSGPLAQERTMFRVFVTILALNGHVLGQMESQEHYKYFAVCQASESKVIEEVNTTLRRLYLDGGQPRAGRANCYVEN